MHVRCPHCHQPVELVDNAGLEHIDCPSCGSHFSLLGDQTASHHAGEVRTIGHFELIERLGMGQFGTVWMARDTELDRTVAVKIPRQEQLSRDDVEMFLREARAAAQLHHPNIVSVHEVGREGDTVYIVSDFVRGVTLADRLTAGRLSPREAAQLCVTIAEALHHAHQAGVIHRDLKPSNIMLDAEGQPHLMDFGLAKREAAEITMTMDGKILGTPAYMSPEQARGEAHQADARSDVYSLGTIMFELLTGELPFRGNKRMLLMQIIHDEPPGPRKLDAAVPRDLETVCLKCLEKSPERRYPTARDLADELRRYLDGQPLHARPIGRIERSWRWCKRNAVVAALAASVLIVLLAGAGISTYFAVEAGQRATAEETAKLMAQRAAKGERQQTIEAQTERANAQQAAARETRQRIEAERQARISNVLRLAAESQAMRAEEPVQAMLLAVEAVRLGQRGDTASRRAARQALRDSFSSVGGTPLLGHEFSVGPKLAISPDGHWLVTLADSVCFWDLTSADPAAQAAHAVIVGRERSIYGLAVSGDGRWLASCGLGGEFRLWDVKSSDPSRNVLKQGAKERLWVSFAANGDGSKLAAGSSDGTICLWNLLDTSPNSDPTVLNGPKSAGGVISIAMNGDWLATLSADSSCRLWNLSTSSPADHSILLCEPYKEGSEIYVAKKLVISPDARWLAITGTSPQLYDLTAIPGRLKPFVLAPSSADTIFPQFPHSVAFSPDGRRLIDDGPGNTVRIWDLAAVDPSEHCSTLGGHTGPVVAVATSADGRWMASGSADKTVRVWDLTAKPNAPPKVLRGHLEPVTQLALSPDGRWLATSCRSDRDKTVRLWDLSRDEAADRTTLRGHTQIVRSAAISSNGRWLATASADATARLWDLDAADPKATSIDLRGHEGDVTAVAFTPDGRRLVTASNDKTARIWDLTTDKPNDLCRVLRGHTGSVSHLVVSSDGKWLATGGHDETPRVWNLAADDPTTSVIVLRHPGKRAGNVGVTRIDGLAFSPDNHWLATGVSGGTVRLWDITAHDPATNPVVLEDARGVAFSSDGRWFVSSNPIAAHGSVPLTRRAIGLWDVNAPGTLGRILESEGSDVRPISFPAQSRWQVGAVVDQAICLWGSTDTALPTETIFLRHPSPQHGFGGQLSRALVMSADGRWVASAQLSDRIHMWDLSEPDPENSGIVLHGAGMPLAVAPNGRFLITIGGLPDVPQMFGVTVPELDGRLRLWRLDDNELISLARAAAGRELSKEERQQFLVPDAATFISADPNND